MLALALGAAVLGAFVAPASANPGKELVTCVGCHDITAAKKQLVGPPLFGLFGEKPTTAGVGFAKWDKTSLDKWLKDPSAVKPGTAMAFAVKNDKKREKIIQAISELK
jgi:cytochrome c2